MENALDMEDLIRLGIITPETAARVRRMGRGDRPVAAGSNEPSPAAGTRKPPEDYRDRGEAPIPAEGSHAPSPALGPTTRADETGHVLGRDRPSLHDLATSEDVPGTTTHYASRDEELADRNSGLSRLHDLSSRDDLPELSDGEYLRETDKAIRGLQDAGHAHVDEHGEMTADDLEPEDQQRLKNMLEERSKVPFAAIMEDDGDDGGDGERTYDPQEEPDKTIGEQHSGIDQEIENARRGIGG